MGLGLGLITGAFEADSSWGTGLQVSVLLAIIGQLLAITFVLRVLERGGSPSATLSWVLFILAAPYVGLIAYYALPRRISRRRLTRRRNRISWIESSLAGDREAAGPAVCPEDPLARMLHKIDPDSVCHGNALSLIESGPDFLARAEAVLAKAKHFVHFETYILRPDPSGVKFIELLTKTAQRGVQVRLLYDSMGSWWLKAHHLRALHEAGGKSAPFMPMFWRRRPFNLNLRNHRKQLFVDGYVGFCGGRNVGDEYMKDRFGEKHRWLDAMVEVEGPAVMRMHRAFVEDWFGATEEDLAKPEYFPRPAPAGPDPIGVVASGPDKAFTTFHWMLFQMFAQATTSIDVSSPYVVPHQTIQTALQVAAARGVRVRIFTNGRASEQPVLYRAQRSYYRDLLASGIEIYETVADYNHAKAIVVDDSHVFVGSPNIDVRSTDLNFEIGVVAFRSTMVGKVREALERHLAAGRRVEVADLASDSRVARISQGICRLMSPLL